MNFTKFPRRQYLQGKTPIEFLPSLTKALGKDVNIYVKRDDLLPGSAGGNKTRSLEFGLADALDKGADTIVTCGAIQSNHCRLTLSWSVKENLDCHLILEERVKGTYNKNATGNNFLYQLLGVKSIKLVPGGSDTTAAMEQKAQALKAQGKTPYIIPIGGSNEIGALGYAACAEEIMHQLNEMHLDIDHMILPSGSGGTHAGMLTGSIGINMNIPITGINVSQTKKEKEEKIYNLAVKVARKLDLKSNITPDNIVCFDDYVGEGYSIATESMVKAVKLFARTEGILLDPVYSGKTAAGLIDLVKKDYFPKGSNLLFLHTGGSPALYAYMDSFR